MRKYNRMDSKLKRNRNISRDINPINAIDSSRGIVNNNLVEKDDDTRKYELLSQWL